MRVDCTDSIRWRVARASAEAPCSERPNCTIVLVRERALDISPRVMTMMGGWERLCGGWKGEWGRDGRGGNVQIDGVIATN